MSDPIEKPAEEAKEKTEEVVETVTDPVAEVVPEPVEEVTENPSDEIPPWGKELTEKVDSILDSLGNVIPAAVEPEEVPRDEAPVDLPWTHRMPFSRKG